MLERLWFLFRIYEKAVKIVAFSLSNRVTAGISFWYSIVYKKWRTLLLFSTILLLWLVRRILHSPPQPIFIYIFSGMEYFFMILFFSKFFVSFQSEVIFYLYFLCREIHYFHFFFLSTFLIITFYLLLFSMIILENKTFL